MDISDELNDMLNKRFDKQDKILNEICESLKGLISIYKQNISKLNSHNGVDKISNRPFDYPKMGNELSKELCDRCGVGSRGGIRASLKNRLIILISSSKYDDLYDKKNGELYYMGELKKEDRKAVKGWEWHKYVKEWKWDEDVEKEDPNVKGRNGTIRNRGGKEKFRIFYFRKQEENEMSICECEVKYHSYSKQEPIIKGRSIKVIIFQLKIIKNCDDTSKY